jgi:hypothetical protein
MKQRAEVLREREEARQREQREADAETPEAFKMLVAEMLESLSVRTEKEAPSDGGFAPISESRANDVMQRYCIDNFMVMVTPALSSEPESRYFKVVASIRKNSVSCVLQKGNKQEILASLRDPTTLLSVLCMFKSLSSDLRSSSMD